MKDEVVLEPLASDLQATVSSDDVIGVGVERAHPGVENRPRESVRRLPLGPALSGQGPDESRPELRVGHDVDDRVEESGTPEDDVPGHVGVRIVIAGRHRVDDHEEEPGQEASDVADADEENGPQHLALAPLDLVLEHDAGAALGGHAGGLSPGRMNLPEDEAVADDHDGEGQEEPERQQECHRR